MIYVFLAEGFEEMEALAPVDILRRAELDVATVAVGTGSKTVRGSHGIAVVCNLSEEEIHPENAEMVVLPGGMPGTLHLEKSQTVQEMLDLAIRNQLWIGAICAAPSILGHRGMTEGKQAVCYPGFEEQLTGAVLSHSSVCVDGKLITAKGAGVAVDFGLQLTACLVGQERADTLRASLQCSR